jgi:hypothetical protein
MYNRSKPRYLPVEEKVVAHVHGHIPEVLRKWLKETLKYLKENPPPQEEHTNVSGR